MKCAHLKKSFEIGVLYYQGWAGYFGNVISYRLLVTVLKM